MQLFDTIQPNDGKPAGGYGRAFLVGLLLLVSPVQLSAEPSQRLDLDMVLSMAGITAGTMNLEVDFNGGDAVSRLRLKSKGPVKLITGYKGKSEARTMLPAETWPIPASYDASYETRKYDRRIAIRYNADDGEIIGLQTWKRGQPRTSDVPEAMRQATIDPLTAILHFRHWVLALRNDPSAAKQRSFEVFDGRRRYRLDAEVLERDEVNFGGDDVPAFRMKVVLTPLAGFSSKDMLANWSDEDGDRWIELVISDDDNPVPLKLETVGGALKTGIYLEKACADDGQSCREFGS